MNAKHTNLLSGISTSSMIIGAFFLIKEIYSFVVYLLGSPGYLPDFRYFPFTHLNICVFLLCIWLILFSYYLRGRNIRAMSILSLLFGAFWILFELFEANFHLGNVYFYVPQGYSRMVFYLDAALTLGVLVRFLWLEAEEEGISEEN